MTDPVDTDALRAAGDELTRIRKPVAIIPIAIGSLFTAADEVDRLRAVLENAPHGINCHYVNPGNGVIERLPECTCWKADVL